MKVLRATAMGMCPGVRKALEIARGMPDPTGVTILGELVHNGEVLRELERRGFARTPESRRGPIPVSESLLITAHGMSDRDRSRYLQAGKRLVDTTCPLVRRIHRTGRLLEQEGRLVLLVGKPGHVEVEGIVGDLNRFEVVPDAAAVRRYRPDRLGVLSQSTVPPHHFRTVASAIERVNHGKDIRVVDTICAPTRDRQHAVRELLKVVDVLVVVGGRHSNNTRELVRLAQSAGVPSQHVETAAELGRDWLARFDLAGLCAGTSTLDRDIDAVHEALLAIEPPGFATDQVSVRRNSATLSMSSQTPDISDGS